MAREYDKVKNAEQSRKWRAANPDRAREIERRHYEKRKHEINARRRVRLATDPEYKRKRQEEHRTWLYGISAAQQRDLLMTQNNRCAICKTEFDFSAKRSYAIDHDHKTNRVRQLLCIPCNSALGLVKENANILREMIKYLEDHNA